VVVTVIVVLSLQAPDLDLVPGGHGNAIDVSLKVTAVTFAARFTISA
jgi:hypothetical protein